jgi:hypothetical protein
MNIIGLDALIFAADDIAGCIQYLIGYGLSAVGANAMLRKTVFGVADDATPIQARTLSHLAYFVPDVVKAEAFYVERLGFRCTDRFAGVGSFLQPAGTLDHHTHFLIGAPAHMQGVEHFTFHFGGPTEVMQNGTRFLERGYQAFWGPTPRRHSCCATARSGCRGRARPSRATTPE